MAAAGTAIRSDLLALARRFPQLKKTNSSTLEKDLEWADQPGNLHISVEHSEHVEGTLIGGEPAGSLGPRERFDFHVGLFERPITEPPATQGLCVLVFPHLWLWGGRGASAEDPALEQELQIILDRRLNPLDRLEAQRVSLPSPSHTNLASPPPAQGG